MMNHGRLAGAASLLLVLATGAAGACRSSEPSAGAAATETATETAPGAKGAASPPAHASPGHAGAPAAAQPTPPARPQPGAPALNDAKIAAIVVTANAIDVDAGKLALSKAKSEEVRKFAQTMITDHTGVNEQAVALATRLGVTPEESEVTTQLKAQAAATLEKLKGLEGDAFDRAYVDNEVTYHVAVLGAIDELLVPNAQNRELKALIVAVRPAIAAHLDHAKSLQASLGR